MHHRCMISPQEGVLPPSGSAAAAQHNGVDALACFLGLFCRDEARGQAEVLLRRFRTLPAVLSARPEALWRMLPDRPVMAQGLLSARLLMLQSMKEDMMAGLKLNRSDQIATYFRAALAWETRELIRVLFLGAGYHLIADEVMGMGTTGEVVISPREILHRALDLGATGLILAHNHPSGDSKASRADIMATQRIVRAGQEMEIAVLDHYIVSRSGWTSLRAEGLL